MTERQRDILYVTLCLLLTLTAIVCCVPIAEIGVNDDWSYARTAFELARTGHLIYNGWSAAMLGAQAYWGALFVRLIGPSFFAVRLSTVVCTLGIVPLQYGLCRRVGASPLVASIGTLTVCLSPMFVPFAVTFMTEMPALFFLLASLTAFCIAADRQYAILSGAASLSDRAFWVASACGVAAGLLGGTVRQIDWILTLIAPFYFVWCALRIRGTGVASISRVLAGVQLFWLIAGVAFIAWATWWFQQQPYAITEPVAAGVQRALHASDHARHSSMLFLFSFAYTLALIILPLAPFLRLPLLARASGWKGSIGAALVLLLAVLFGLWLRVTPPWLRFTWLSNTLSERPLWPGLITGGLDGQPIYLSSAVRMGISWAVVLFTTSWFLCAVARLGRKSIPVPPAVALSLLFGLAYTPLMVLKLFTPFSFGVFDRYTLPLLPFGVLVLLWMYVSETESRQPGSVDHEAARSVFAAVAVALYAFYGVARTHDYFSQQRAIVAVTNDLMRRGIPRTSIMGGFEFDGWTEIVANGCYNDPRILLPRDAYQPSPPQDRMPATYRYFQWNYTPSVQARYYVSPVAFSDQASIAVAPTSYSTWMPPHTRNLYLQTLDSSLAGTALPPVVPATSAEPDGSGK